MTLTPVRTACLGLALALSIGAVPQGARADMMAACSADIGKFCSDVANGRGRITACLMAYDDDLSAACRPEVDALAQRSSTNRLIPANARQISLPAFGRTFRQAARPMPPVSAPAFRKVMAASSRASIRVRAR